MTKVNINGHEHQVEIEADGDLDEVAEAARTLWEATLQPPSRLGPASAGQDVGRRVGYVGYAYDLGGTDRPEVTG